MEGILLYIYSIDFILKILHQFLIYKDGRKRTGSMNFGQPAKIVRCQSCLDLGNINN
jgi:hypothetical protein